jgi:hypothetical protein
LLVIITLFLNNYHLNPLSPPNEKTIWNGNFDHRLNKIIGYSNKNLAV